VVECEYKDGVCGVNPVSVSTEKRTVWEPKQEPGSLSLGVARATVLAAKRMVWEPEDKSDSYLTPDISSEIAVGRHQLEFIPSVVESEMSLSLGSPCGVTMSLLDSTVPQAWISERVQPVHPPVSEPLSIYAEPFRPQAVAYSLGCAVVDPHSTKTLDVRAATFRPAKAPSACAAAYADFAVPVTAPFAAGAALSRPDRADFVAGPDAFTPVTAFASIASRLNALALPFTPLVGPCGPLVGERGVGCSHEH
jgi:hypothetical protein